MATGGAATDPELAGAAVDFNPPEPQMVASREIERLSQRRAD